MSAAVLLRCDGCAHLASTHGADDGCRVPDCDCMHSALEQLVHRASLAPVAKPIRPEPEVNGRGERGPTLEQVLAAGKRSEHSRTVKLTEKIALLIHDLRGRLADEREATEAKRQQDAAREVAKRQIAELEAKLAELRKAMRGGSASPGTSPAISGVGVTCAHCDKVFGTQRGLTHHVTVMHAAVSA